MTTGLPFNEDFAAVRLIDAVDDLAQRRLAGAVFTAQNMNATRLDRETHVAKRLDAGEQLFDPPQFKEWNVVHAAPLLVV
ncbi:MAG: hypothetical protein QM739_19195 [Propionivibrio sp.]